MPELVPPPAPPVVAEVPFYRSPIFVGAIGLVIVHGYKSVSVILAKNGVTIPLLPDDAWSVGNQAIDIGTVLIAYLIAHRRARNKPSPTIEPMKATVARMTGETKPAG